MDYSGRNAATAEDFDEANRKLWRALSQSILQSSDGPRSELVQALARRKSGGPVTDDELGDLLQGGRHAPTCREDASGMGLLAGVQRQQARDLKALRSILKSSGAYPAAFGRARGGPFASRPKDRNLSADVARGAKAGSPVPRAPQRQPKQAKIARASGKKASTSNRDVQSAVQPKPKLPAATNTVGSKSVVQLGERSGQEQKDEKTAGSLRRRARRSK